MSCLQEIDTIVCPATPEHPRQSEASILPFEDGRLFLAYTDFYDGEWCDEGAARIMGKWSRDEGKTWSEPFVVQENIGRLNVMGASLLRLPSGRILLAFMRKDMQPGLLHLMVKFSDDECANWSEPTQVTYGDKYWCSTNDRLVRLSTGRILLPTRVEGWGAHCWYSDDDGQTWQCSTHPLPETAQKHAEPTVVELKNGKVAMLMRNRSGRFHVARSNNGERWHLHTEQGPPGPASPCIVKRIPDTGHLLLVWNNSQVRTPITTGVSEDDGETWKHIRNLEEMDGWPVLNSYAYPTLAFLNGMVHLTYWQTHLAPEGRRFYHLKYRRLPVAWFYEAPSLRNPGG